MLVEIPDHLAAKIKSQVESLVDREISQNEMVERLNSEDDLAWFSADYFIRVPIVRSSTYNIDPSKIPLRMLIRGCGVHMGITDPPVIMRGSRDSCHKRYCRSVGGSNPFGWLSAVVRRYIRMSKITTVSANKEWLAMRDKIIAKMWERCPGGGLRWIDLPDVHFRSGLIYIEGRPRFVEPDTLPAIKSLSRQLNKVNSVDAAIERIADHATHDPQR